MEGEGLVGPRPLPVCPCPGFFVLHGRQESGREAAMEFDCGGVPKVLRK